jgi:hypothetical protein
MPMEITRNVMLKKCNCRWSSHHSRFLHKGLSASTFIVNHLKCVVPVVLQANVDVPKFSPLYDDDADGTQSVAPFI